MENREVQQSDSTDGRSRNTLKEGVTSKLRPVGISQGKVGNSFPGRGSCMCKDLAVRSYQLTCHYQDSPTRQAWHYCEAHLLCCPLLQSRRLRPRETE